jgi:hypothetical protein
MYNITLQWVHATTFAMKNTVSIKHYQCSLSFLRACCYIEFLLPTLRTYLLRTITVQI